MQQQYTLREQTLEKNALAFRIRSLHDALTEAEIDKAKANAALRQLFSGISISWKSETLEFQWQHSAYVTPVQFAKDGTNTVRPLTRPAISPPVAPLPLVPEVPPFKA